MHYTMDFAMYLLVSVIAFLLSFISKCKCLLYSFYISEKLFPLDLYLVAFQWIDFTFPKAHTSFQLLHDLNSNTRQQIDQPTVWHLTK